MTSLSEYSAIIIVFNPNSTGGAPEKARKLKDQLAKKLPSVEIKLIETQRAGHAAEITREQSRQYKCPLVISVSGDGGYNEVVNGAMALPKGRRPICAVFPAGNANDHRAATKENELVEAIVNQKTFAMDLLRIKAAYGQTRYAHSYIGLGITPAVAVELNRHTLNALREALIVIRTFSRYTPFVIKLDGTERRLNSLVFANISRMAKVLTLSEDSSQTDGKFEVITIPDLPKRKLLLIGLKAAFSTLKPDEQTSSFSFEISDPMPIQLDGEVMELKKGQKVSIGIERQTLTVVA